MTAPVFLTGDLPAYRVAIASLSHSAARADGPAGALAVIRGDGAWWEDARRAAAGGAVALLVDDPEAAPTDVPALRDELGVPVLVRRPSLRSGMVDDALRSLDGAAVRSVVAECQASFADAPRVVRDAVGWMRVLTGGADGVPAVLRGRPGRHGTTARLRWAGGVGASLIVTLVASGGGLLRVRASGETALEIDLDAPMGRSVLGVGTSAGWLVTPPRHEQPEREALRRALELVRDGSPTGDLAAFGADAATAATILAR